MPDDKPKREELSAEDALRMLAAREAGAPPDPVSRPWGAPLDRPHCASCGVAVGRGIDRCTACLRKDQEAEVLRAQIARAQQVVTALDRGPSSRQTAFDALHAPLVSTFSFGMALVALLGLVIAGAGSGSSYAAFLFGVSLCSIGVGSIMLRATILSALRAAAQEKIQFTTASQPPVDPPKT